MKRYFWSLALVLAAGLLLTSGCAPKTAKGKAPAGQVAGTHEQYPAGQPTTPTTAPTTPPMVAAVQEVTVTITDEKITVSPTSIPTGNISVLVVNKSSKSQSLLLNGPVPALKTGTIPPGKSVTLALKKTKPGEYTVTMPGTPGEKPTGMMGKFNVTSPTKGGKPPVKPGTAPTTAPTATPAAGGGK